MATIVQQTIALNSQNQLRSADRLAREWAIAHAGAYQSQARKQLGGSRPLREWKKDNLSIRIAKLTSGAFKQVQLACVDYMPAGGGEPYAGYIMTYAYSETEQLGGHCISVTSRPDTLSNAEFPWDDKAGPVGLERTMASIRAGRDLPSGSVRDSQRVTAISDLFAVYDTAVVLTERGQEEAELQELADVHGEWSSVVSITAAEQIALSHELPDHQLRAWMQAKVAFFSRYAGGDGSRLRMVENDYARATAFMDEERERVRNNIVSSNTINVLKVLESVSTMLSISNLTDAADMAEGSLDSAAQPEPEAGGTDAPDSASAQQRVFILEDKLSEAEDIIAELRERLAQYEAFEVDDPPDDDDDLAPEALANSNRQIAVLDAITSPDRFARLRFLTNCVKPLESYGKPRPTGMEILQALDAINNLAQAWFNTPGGNIGSWSNYFKALSGWKHADDESEFTMSRFGEKRSFSDPDHERLVEITRHLTYQGSSGGLQIYFDRDDVTQTFIIGYIGEHLPYATSRS